MSNVRLKLIATASPEELENQANNFLAQDDIEVKQLDYQTDGYERPYSAAILYHEKEPKQ